MVTEEDIRDALEEISNEPYKLATQVVSPRVYDFHRWYWHRGGQEQTTGLGSLDAIVEAYEKRETGE